MNPPTTTCDWCLRETRVQIIDEKLWHFWKLISREDPIVASSRKNICRKCESCYEEFSIYIHKCKTHASVIEKVLTLGRVEEEPSTVTNRRPSEISNEAQSRSSCPAAVAEPRVIPGSFPDKPKKFNRWNSVTTTKFIREFKSNECLWNQRAYSCRNKHAIDAAYQNIVEEMRIAGFGVPEAKKKMRTLRSTYYQEKKKIQRSVRSGADKLYVPTIPWYDEMEALLKNGDHQHIRVDKVPNPLNLNESFDADREEPYAQVPQRRSASSRRGTPRGSERSQGPIDKNREDQFDVFGKSVAIQLRALSYERALTAQSKVQAVLSELAIEDHRSGGTNGVSSSEISDIDSRRSTPIMESRDELRD